ncbi:MAG: hypothetical protein ABII22_03780 [Candidatus Micrarchaeota archaeon]
MNPDRRLRRPNHAPEARSSSPPRPTAPLDTRTEQQIEVQRRAARMVEGIKINDPYFHSVVQQLATGKHQSVEGFIAELALGRESTQELRKLVEASYETHGRFRTGEVKIDDCKLGNLNIVGSGTASGEESILVTLTGTTPRAVGEIIREMNDCASAQEGVSMPARSLHQGEWEHIRDRSTAPEITQLTLQFNFQQGTKTPERIKKWILSLESMPRNKWKQFELFRSCMVELAYRVDQIQAEAGLPPIRWVSLACYAISQEHSDSLPWAKQKREIGSYRYYDFNDGSYSVSVRNMKDGNKFQPGENEDGVAWPNRYGASYFVVGDGVGGHGGGGECNELVLNEVASRINAGVEEDLAQIIAGANQKLKENKVQRTSEGDNSLEKGGTTIAIAKLTRNAAGITIIDSANVGDSNGHALSFDSTAVPITTEHSLYVELTNTEWKPVIVTREMQNNMSHKWPEIREGMEIMRGPNGGVHSSPYSPKRFLTVADAKSVIVRTLDGNPAKAIPSVHRTELLLGLVVLETDGITDITKAHGVPEFTGTVDPVIHAERRIRFAIANDNGGKNDDRTCIAAKVGNELETIAKLKQEKDCSRLMKFIFTYQYEDIAIGAMNALVELGAVEQLAGIANEPRVRDKGTKEYAKKKAKETVLQKLDEMICSGRLLRSFGMFAEEDQPWIIQQVDALGTEGAHTTLERMLNLPNLAETPKKLILEILGKREILKINEIINEVTSHEDDVAVYGEDTNCETFISLNDTNTLVGTGQFLMKARALTQNREQFKERVKAIAYRNALDSGSISSATRLRVTRKLCAIIPQLNEGERESSKVRALSAIRNEKNSATKRELTEIAIEAKMISGVGKIFLKAKFLAEDATAMFNKARGSTVAIIGSLGAGLLNIPAWVYVASQETTFAIGKFMVFGIIGTAVGFIATLIGAGMILTGLEMKKEQEKK